MITGTWGLFNAFAQIVLVGKLIKTYGASNLYRTAYASFCVCVLTYPVSTYLARRNGGISFGVCASIFIQLLFQTLIFMGYSMYPCPSTSVRQAKPSSLQVQFMLSPPKILRSRYLGLSTVSYRWQDALCGRLPLLFHHPYSHSLCKSSSWEAILFTLFCSLSSSLVSGLVYPCRTVKRGLLFRGGADHRKYTIPRNPIQLTDGIMWFNNL
jgi:hypothetical protein